MKKMMNSSATNQKKEHLEKITNMLFAHIPTVNQTTTPQVHSPLSSVYNHRRPFFSNQSLTPSTTQPSLPPASAPCILFPADSWRLPIGVLRVRESSVDFNRTAATVPPSSNGQPHSSPDQSSESTTPTTTLLYLHSLDISNRRQKPSTTTCSSIFSSGFSELLFCYPHAVAARSPASLLDCSVEALTNNYCSTKEQPFAMAYGGPTVGSTAAGGPTTIRQVKLDKECEFRVEVSPDAPLRLRLLTGSAEIYGTEIPPEIWLTFPPRLKFAVFTWYGATIEVDGTAETDYTADETPMISYVNVHAVLEARRNRAIASPGDSDASQGPRVIVVGPTDSGKSTLSRMLLSWAAKQGWKPTFVDLDIGQGSITIPGCIAATPIELPIDPVEGIPLDMPLVYFHGHTTPSVNVDLYKVLVKELAQILERQFAGNAESRAAGMVINTMGWIESTGYELLLHAIDTFNATVILVLGQEKLCSMLKDVLKNKPNVDVVKLQKSGGVVSRNAKFRQKARSHRIREYFYGLSNDLSPHSNVANFSDLCIFRIGGGPQAPRSALPIGAEPAADPTRLTPVNINRDLLHSVLAVSFAKEPEEIISSNVAGFIWITDIDFESKKITYLAPSAGSLPGKYLIQGSLIWYEP